jgi:hypothetical protein
LTDTHSPSPGVLESVVTDDDLLKPDVSTHASRGEDVTPLSKQVMKAYRRAKKAGKAQDTKARRTCAMLRDKRDGTDHPFEPVTREESAPKVQTLLSDF